jgi:two-component system sensor histidine kinase EvgS
MNFYKLFILNLLLIQSCNIFAQLDLSEEERLWIEKNPIIRTAGSSDWKPFDFTVVQNNIRKHQGISQDILVIISEKTGLIFDMHINEWSVNLKSIQENKLDLLPILSYTKERANYLDFSETYLDSIEFFFVRDDLQVTSIKDLNGYRVAIPMDFSYETLFKKHYPNIEIVHTNNNIESIVAVLEGNADMLYDSYAALSFSLKQLGISTIVPFKASDIEPFTNQYMAVTKDNKILLSIINKALATISQNQKNKIFTKWDKSKPVVRFVKQTDYQLYYWTLYILLSIIAIILTWAKTLRREIKKTNLAKVALSQEKFNFQTLFENTSDGHVIFRDNRFLDCNETVVNMLGYDDKESFLKQDLFVIINADQSEGKDSINLIQENINKCLKNGSVRFEYFAKHKKGNRFWIDIILTLIKYNGKNAIYATWRDISSQKQLAEDLLNAQQIANKANQAKSDFLANMSHEIRTPMNAILGFTDLLDEQLENPKHQSFVKTIKNASKNLLSLINDILDLSKIEAGKFKSTKTATNPYDFINEICHVFSLSLQEKDLAFEIEIDPLFPNSIVIDSTHIRQVLFNLFSNAIKFTAHGHIIFRAKVDAINEQLNKLNIILEVEDTGIGIEEDQLERIFNVFEQHKEQDKNQYQGTGLGLSISKKLIENMGGEIMVSSEKGKGSCFIIKLYEVDIASKEAENYEVTKNNEPNTIKFEKSRILIVDDINYNRDLIVQIFDKTLVSVIQAEDGLKAIEQVESQSIDLVVMDIRMPVMDGYEASKILKKSHPSLPIVALTASTAESDRSQHPELFDAYIRKPVIKNHLLDTLAKYLPHSKIKKDSIKLVKSKNLKKYNPKSLNALIGNLEKEAILLWEKATKSNHFNDINALADKLNKISDEYPVNELSFYVKDLQTNIELFDIAGLQKTILEFPQLIEKIKTLKK